MKISKKSLDVINKLSQEIGVSGHERYVGDLLEKYYSDLGYPIVKDNIGSLFAYKKSKNPDAKVVVLMAHQDEVGFIVNNVLENGLIKLKMIGGLFDQTLLASRLVLKTRTKEIYHGVISALAPHLLTPEMQNSVFPFSKMLADFGFVSREDASNHGVSVGDQVVVEGPMHVLNDQFILTKALDNRLGCAVGVELLTILKDVELDYDLYIGASVQEEVGLRGAQTSTKLVNPDLAIVVDCSPANDVVVTKDEVGSGEVGKGVLVRFVDRSMIAFKDLLDYEIQQAKAAKVPYQYFYSYGGTDAGIVHTSNEGIPTLTTCLCARNIHTCSSIMSISDYLNLIKLLTHIFKDLDTAKISKLSHHQRILD